MSSLISHSYTPPAGNKTRFFPGNPHGAQTELPILSCWEIDGGTFRYLEAGRDEFGVPRPTFGRTCDVGVDLTHLPPVGNWPEMTLATSPEENDGAVLVLHPWSCVTFFSSVESSLNPNDVKSRVENEAHSLVGNARFLVESEYIRSGFLGEQRVDHLFVTCVPESVLDLMPLLSDGSVQVRSSLSSVASLVLESTPVFEGLSLILGWYHGFLEVTILREDDWLFGGFTSYRDPHDTLYYLASLLDKLDLNPLDLERIMQYGPEIERAPSSQLSQLFATNPESLIPHVAFPDADEKFLSMPAFIPCAGGILKQLLAEI